MGRQIRTYFLAIVLTLGAIFAPWRLLRLGVDVLWLRNAPSHMASGNDQYWDALRMQQRIQGFGYTVYYQSGLNWNGVPVYGLTIPSEHTVAIDADLSWNGRYMVLAHEAGHILSPYYLQANRVAGDVFAESVATLVVGGSAREHARYLADDKGMFVLTVLAEWRAIYHAAAVLQD